MKKLILFSCIVIFCSSCAREFSDNYWRWGIVNNTDQTLVVKITNDNNEYNVYSLPSETYEFLFENITRHRDKMQFNDYFSKIANLYGDDVVWQILSEDEITVLKTWRYSDRDLPNQRFLDETSWSFQEWNASGGHEHFWSFAILLEDIRPIE